MAVPSHSVRDLLITMLNEPVPDWGSTPFRQVIGRLIAQASAGEWQALKEIFDRLDGPPAAPADDTRQPHVIVLETGIRWPREPSQPGGI